MNNKLKEENNHLKASTLEMSGLKNVIKIIENELKTLTEAHSTLEVDHDIMKQENRNLKAVKIELLKTIESKNQNLEKSRIDFACEKCSKTKTSKEIPSHVKSGPYIAKQDKFFNCKECRLTFNQENDLKTHNSLRHPEKSVFSSIVKQR